MENKALYHEVAIERENGSLDCLPATRYNFIAQTPTCPTHQLSPGSPIVMIRDYFGFPNATRNVYMSLLILFLLFYCLNVLWTSCRYNVVTVLLNLYS